MDGFAIRRADADDIETLIGARIGMLSDLGETDESVLAAVEAAFRDYLAEAMSDPAFEAWIAHDGEEDIGTAIVVFYRLPPGPRNPTGRIAHLLNVYVRPDRRRQGIATALVGHVVERAEQRGASVVDLIASDQGRHVYDRLGFTPSAAMRLSLHDIRDMS